MLLFWGILEPSGSASNVSAVRFSAPVCIQTLRIFPSGARPFKSKEDIVAVTEPESLYLDVFFNSQPTSAEAKGKVKPSNTLVSTSIAYQGGQVEFNVDTEKVEFTTRIMIIRGKFTKLSLAVYGTTAPESPTAVSIYQPKSSNQKAFTAIPTALDPANKADPSDLAHSLLTLIPDAPDLRLIIRLMFCLKPSNEDWEEKDFPHLYSDLERDLDDLNLDRAVEMTARPVSDTVEEHVLKTFALRLGDSVIDYNDDDAYLLAKLLSQCAPQHPLLIRHITENIDIVQMYSSPANLDRPTLLYLLDAASSLDVSHQLKHEDTLDAIVSIRDGAFYDDGARRAASRLLERIKGWESLEEALSNTQPSFQEAAVMMKEIALEENSFGIWLENMISNPDIAERLLENRTIAQSIPHPPLMWQNETVTSQDQFMAFVKAVIGVAAVVAVYAWSDSVPIYACRERALGILRFWQSIVGYREIVNHFLLMRQMTYRLECMLPLDDDLPSHASIDAEHILNTLSAYPESFLRADFVKVIQNLQWPLNYMTDVRINELRRLSDIAKEGLSGAIRTIVSGSDAPDVSQSLQELRIAVAIVIGTMEKQANGELQVMETLWSEGYSGLSVYLVDTLANITEDLRSNFSLQLPSGRTNAEIALLFLTCLDVLRLVMRVVEACPLNGRYLSSLTCSIADIFICTDSAGMMYSQGGDSCEAADLSRQPCVQAIAYLINPPTVLETARWSAPVALKALLTHASDPGEHDAMHHLTQIFWLLDQALPVNGSDTWGPDPKSRKEWIHRTLPQVLPEFRRLYVMLEPDNKARLTKRLKELDEGCVGLAEWLLLEEQRSLSRAIRSSTVALGSAAKRCALWRVSASFSVLDSLIRQTSCTHDWALDVFLQEEDQVDLLRSNFNALLEMNVCFEYVEVFATTMVTNRCSDLDKSTRASVLGILCQSVRCRRFNVLADILHLVRDSNESIFNEKTAREFGEALEEISHAVKEDAEGIQDRAETIFLILAEVTPLDNSKSILAIPGLTEESLNVLARWLTDTLPVGQSTKLEAMKLRWTVSGKPRSTPDFISSSYVPETTLEEWEDLLKPPVPVPSTPTRRSPAQSAEILGLVTVSPPNALLRSPEVKGLTKTYQNNDFRQLRQSTATRQNTSRLPSTHVDDFEQGTSSGVAPLNTSSSPPPTLNFAATQRPVPLDLSLPMNPMYYQNPPQ